MIIRNLTDRTITYKGVTLKPGETHGDRPAKEEKPKRGRPKKDG